MAKIIMETYALCFFILNTAFIIPTIPDQVQFGHPAPVTILFNIILVNTYQNRYAF